MLRKRKQRRKRGERSQPDLGLGQWPRPSSLSSPLPLRSAQLPPPWPSSLSASSQDRTSALPSLLAATDGRDPAHLWLTARAHTSATRPLSFISRASSNRTQPRVPRWIQSLGIAISLPIASTERYKASPAPRSSLFASKLRNRALAAPVLELEISPECANFPAANRAPTYLSVRAKSLGEPAMPFSVSPCF